MTLHDEATELGPLALGSSEGLGRTRADVAVLFARADSHYKALPAVDVWDEARDALQWPGGMSLVAHPPCRLWASLRTKAKAPPEEKELARFAMAQVRLWGGCVEHPWLSTLWDEFELRGRRHKDSWGGWLMPVDLFSFGFQARKRTGIYVVGVRPQAMPSVPLRLGEATHTIGLWSGRDKANCRPSIAKAMFDQTPPEMASWMVDVARRCQVRPNVRVEAGPTARCRARAGENVPRTTGPGLVACRWASPRTRG